MHLVTLSSLKLLNSKKEQVGEHKVFTVEEVKGTDGTVTYDAMKAVVTVAKHDEHEKLSSLT